MTRIYLVRHCEALGNAMRIFQGSTDLDVSELGAKQLPYLTKYFEKTELSSVYSSPLIRTVKTAEAIVGSKSLKIKTEQGLIELHGGIVEGKPFGESLKRYPELADAWNNHPEDFHPEGGESMRSAYERIWETVLKIAKENKGKTVACATHGGVIRCLNCRLIYNNINALKNTPWSENTAITLVEFDDNLNPSPIMINNSLHLPKSLINRKARVEALTKGEKK